MHDVVCAFASLSYLTLLRMACTSIDEDGEMIFVYSRGTKVR